MSFLTVCGGGGGGLGVNGRFLIAWGDSGSGASFRRDDCDDLPGASFRRELCDDRRRSPAPCPLGHGLPKPVGLRSREASVLRGLTAQEFLHVQVCLCFNGGLFGGVSAVQVAPAVVVGAR